MLNSCVDSHVCVYFSDTGEATLRIVGVASDDDGVYTCVATNELGSVTSSASLRVLGKRREQNVQHRALCTVYSTHAGVDMN